MELFAVVAFRHGRRQDMQPDSQVGILQASLLMPPGHLPELDKNGGKGKVFFLSDKLHLPVP